MGTLAHHDPVGYVYPSRLEIVNLLEKHVRIDYDAVADDVQRLRPEYAAWYKVEAELAVVGDDGVSGVVATGESRDHLRVPRKIVNYLALAFIAPLGTQDCVSRHPLPLINESSAT